MPPKDGKGGKPKVSLALETHADIDLKRIVDTYPKIAAKYNLDVITSVYSRVKAELNAVREGTQLDVPKFPIIVTEPMTYDGVRALLAVLESYPWLRQLSLWRCHVGDDGAMLVAEFLKYKFKVIPEKNPWGVEIIELPENSIGPRGAGFIGRMLTPNETVKVLNLDFNPIGDEGAQYLGDGLKWNSTLETLSLQYCGIGPIGGEALGTFVVRSSSVKDLRLRGNPLGPHGVTQIAHALAKNAYLTRLDLADTSFGIDLEAVEALRDGIESNDTLESLDLNLNSIVPAGVSMLVEIIPKKPKLTRMELYERIGQAVFNEAMTAITNNIKAQRKKGKKGKKAAEKRASMAAPPQAPPPPPATT
eukprot:PhM_4_TR7681/c0_g1_i1/m.74219